jgi:hypothetical protein
MKFILLHQPKTGGTSVHKALALHLISDWKKKTHNPQQKIKQQYIDDPNVKIITILRNPYDRLVSHWNFSQKPNKIKHIKTPGHPVYGCDTFSKFLKSIDIHKDKVDYFMRPEYFMCRNDNIIIDHFIKFETLTEDFNSLCKTYNLDIELPHINKNVHKNTGYASDLPTDKSKIYTHEQRKWVEETYKLVFDIGQYSYEQWLNNK